MLTRFVRIQLLIFTIIGVIGVIAMVLFYIQAPTLLGIGRMTVTLELPATGGLYRFSNVTYRGVEVGKVTAVALTKNGAKATLSLGTSPKVPANLEAEVLSVSAVGEQYVDLRPRTDSGPFLHDGSVIAVHDTTIPQAVGPMLDQVSALVKSLPQNKIGQLLDESFQAFNGSGYDLGSLSDSASRISADANSVVDRTRALTEDAQPLLDDQLDPAVGAQPGRHFRCVGERRFPVSHAVAGRSRGVERGVPALCADQADAAALARQPDHDRADRHHLPPFD